MVKVACFQATALDAHVVIVVGPQCLCSILKFSDEWGIKSLFDLQNKAYELSLFFYGRDLSTPRNQITMDRTTGNDNRMHRSLEGVPISG